MHVQTRLFMPMLWVTLTASCALSGSLVFERLDQYVASYFKEFADFSNEQKRQIETFTADYQNLFARQQLPKIKSVLIALKSLDRENPKPSVLVAYRYGYSLLRTTNEFFEMRFVLLAKTLSDEQIQQIEQTFIGAEADRANAREKDTRSFAERVEDRYVKGFKRIGLKLNEKQRQIVRDSTNDMHKLAPAWRIAQKNWVDALIALLLKRHELGFDEALITHLRAQQTLGGVEFQEKMRANQDQTVNVIAQIFAQGSDKQITAFVKKLDFYVGVIDRILARRKIQSDDGLAR